MPTWNPTILLGVWFTALTLSTPCGAAGKTPPAGAKPAAVKPVTHAEAEALSKRIDAAAAKGDFSVLATAIDDEAILARAMEGLQLTAEDRATLMKSRG